MHARAHHMRKEELAILKKTSGTLVSIQNFLMLKPIRQAIEMKLFIFGILMLATLTSARPFPIGERTSYVHSCKYSSIVA